MQEHLTKYTKTLLMTTRSKLNGTYEFPGYVMNGQVRCKKAKGQKFSIIKSVHDISLLLSDSDNTHKLVDNEGK